MSAILIAVVMLWNLFASYWNARYVGEIWHETKAVGGWTHVVTWSAGIQSALGFTMIYAVIVAFVGGITGYLPASLLALMANLLWLAIVIPAIGSGLAIVIECWIRYKREKSLLNLGVASLNTVIEAWNIYHAVTSFEGVWKNIKESVNIDEDFDVDSDLFKAIILVVFVLFGGIITTVFIAKKSMGTLPIPESVMEKTK